MTDPNKLNTAALAFIGDAVYEVYVRKHVLKTGSVHSDALHREAVRYVSAEGQARAIEALVKEGLTEDELKLVKRARNHKASSSKRTKASHRGSDIMTDKWATAFEALLGALYLKEETARLEELIELSFDIIEGKQNE